MVSWADRCLRSYMYTLVLNMHTLLRSQKHGKFKEREE